MELNPQEIRLAIELLETSLQNKNHEELLNYSNYYQTVATNLLAKIKEYESTI